MKTENLTLKEAIESGKPFKRICEDHWLIEDGNKIKYMEISNIYPYDITPNEVLATDYELKVEPCTIVLYRFTLIDSDGTVFQTDWINKSDYTVEHPEEYFTLLLTEAKTVEVDYEK